MRNKTNSFPGSRIQKAPKIKALLYLWRNQMSRKPFFLVLSAAALVLGVAAASFGQTSPVSGTVELQKADGTKEPVAGALVEIYRVDIKGGGLSTKTGKKGDFVFVGVLIGGKFVFAVSAPGCSPIIFPNVRAGQEKLLITLSPGDGRKLTEAEVRSGASAAVANSGGDGGKLTAEQQKERAEQEKKNAEIAAKNDKALKANEIVGRVVKEGDEAFNAKNYDLAIAKYEEGIAADPDFAGFSVPLNNNRAQALQRRGLDARNNAVKPENEATKTEGLAKAKKDFTDSAAGYLRAWEIMKVAPPTDLGDKLAINKSITLNGAIETFRLAGLTNQVDPSLVDAAKVLVPEYLALETDSAKKTTAGLQFAELYVAAGDSENAVAAYRKVMEASPENADAMVGAGLSLVNLGFIQVEEAKSKNDNAMADAGKKNLQEAANLLGKFVSVAPDNHKYKKDAIEAIATLKNLQNVAPQKVASPGKKKT